MIFAKCHNNILTYLYPFHPSMLSWAIPNSDKNNKRILVYNEVIIYWLSWLWYHIKVRKWLRCFIKIINTIKIGCNSFCAEVFCFSFSFLLTTKQEWHLSACWKHATFIIALCGCWCKHAFFILAYVIIIIYSLLCDTLIYNKP